MIQNLSDQNAHHSDISKWISKKLQKVMIYYFLEIKYVIDLVLIGYFGSEIFRITLIWVKLLFNFSKLLKVYAKVKIATVPQNFREHFLSVLTVRIFATVAVKSKHCWTLRNYKSLKTFSSRWNCYYLRASSHHLKNKVTWK